MIFGFVICLEELKKAEIETHVTGLGAISVLKHSLCHSCLYVKM
jgi:hypothetical protein